MNQKRWNARDAVSVSPIQMQHLTMKAEAQPTNGATREAEPTATPAVGSGGFVRRQRAVRLDKDGVPEDANDWTVEDWTDLWHGIQRIKKKIAARHRVPPNAVREPSRTHDTQQPKT